MEKKRGVGGHSVMVWTASAKYYPTVFNFHFFVQFSLIIPYNLLLILFFFITVSTPSPPCPSPVVSDSVKSKGTARPVLSKGASEPKKRRDCSTKESKVSSQLFLINWHQPSSLVEKSLPDDVEQRIRARYQAEKARIFDKAGIKPMDEAEINRRRSAANERGKARTTMLQIKQKRSKEEADKALQDARAKVERDHKARKLQQEQERTRKLAIQATREVRLASVHISGFGGWLGRNRSEWKANYQGNG